MGSSLLYKDLDSISRDEFAGLLDQGASLSITDTNGDSVLSKAVIAHRLDLVKIVLEAPQELDLSARSKDSGFTPLHHAVKGRHERIVGLLLDKQELLDKTTSRELYSQYINDTADGLTPLMVASKNHRTRIVNLLLSRGANVNAQTSSGKSAVMLAADDWETAEILLKHKGIDKNLRDDRGWSVMTYATEAVTLEVVKLLLADDQFTASLIDDTGLSPLFHLVQVTIKSKCEYERERTEWLGFPTRMARLDNKLQLDESRQRETSQLLLEEMDVSSMWIRGEGEAILSLLAKCPRDTLRCQHILPEILGAGRADNIDWKGESGHSPLAIATLSGNKRFIEIYLDNSANQLNILSDDWRLTLSEGLSLLTGKTSKSQKGHSEGEQIQMALCSILILSSSDDGDEMSRYLKDSANFDVNWTNEDNRTLLWFAADEGHVRIVRKLLELGVEVYTRDKWGDSPLARSLEHKEVFNLVLDNMTQSRSRHEILLWAAAGDNSKLCQGLINAQPSFREEKDQDDVTLLIHASKNGCQRVVDTLLQSPHGDVCGTDKTGRSALHWAAENKHIGIIKLLLDKDKLAWVRICHEGHVEAMSTLIQSGLSKFVRDEGGRTPLHHVSLSGNVEMARLILATDADLDVKDHHGMTPLTLAGLQKNQRMMNLLLEHGAAIDAISRKEWLEYYEQKDDPSVILEIFEISRAKYVNILPTSLTGLAAKQDGSKSLRRLRSYGHHEPLYAMIKDDDYASNPGFELVLDQPLFHGDRHKAGWYNIVQLCFPERKASDLSPDSLYKVNSATIQWKMDWEASLYATTIPIGCIPKDAAEILVHLCEHNERKWMEFCDWADGYLDGLRLDQIEKKGTNAHIINRLANDAQTWAKLRKLLMKQHPRNLRNLVAASSPLRQNPAIKSFDDSFEKVTQRIVQLDNTTRDLLHLEFAWVSIREAHLSTSLATSMKRLSWITSVFGMNVNIFKDNPEWWWFVIVSSIVLALTIVVWLGFKYGQLERILEAQIGQRLERFFGHHRPTKDAEN
ncbi:ankyrin repeat-containing domain protein [Apiospora arundinis]|uniref:Ankyrin repeat-containing domain protein n=1 Tax=Apiospora arundinis TaxID=335852 RepID=A0ABR2I344_9PEZI